MLTKSRLGKQGFIVTYSSRGQGMVAKEGQLPAASQLGWDFLNNSPPMLGSCLT